MSNFPIALTGVPTEELKMLLRFVHQGVIPTPLDPGAVAMVGLQHRSEELMQSMRGLDEAGVRAVLVAVLGERIELERRLRG